MTRKKCEFRTKIYFTDLKPNQIIKIENDDNFYLVVKSGQKFYLIPIDINKKFSFNYFDLKHPLIKSVYDVRNGDCVMQVIEENDADDEGDEINYE